MVCMVTACDPAEGAQMAVKHSRHCQSSCPACIPPLCLRSQGGLLQATVLEAVLPLWAHPKLAQLPRLHVIVVRILTQVRMQS